MLHFEEDDDCGGAFRNVYVYADIYIEEFFFDYKVAVADNSFDSSSDDNDDDVLL